jgi:hypothetical protein
VLNAAYLTAFVQSSCSAIAMAKAGSDLKLRTGNNKLFKLVVVERSDCRHDEVAQRNRLVFPAENHECLTNRSQTLAIGRECVGRRRRTLESSLASACSIASKFLMRWLISASSN